MTRIFSLAGCVHRQPDIDGYRERCPVCDKPRSLMQATRDVSATRDVPLRFFEPDNVVALHPAARRDKAAS